MWEGSIRNKLCYGKLFGVTYNLPLWIVHWSWEMEGSHHVWEHVEIVSEILLIQPFGKLVEVGRQKGRTDVPP